MAYQYSQSDYEIVGQKSGASKGYGQSIYALTPWAKQNATAQRQAAEDLQNRQDELISSYMNAYGEAKDTNLARYEDILKGYNERYSSAITGLEGMGDAEKADLARNFAIAGSRQNQALVNSGLSSTTIRPAVMQQNQSAMQRALALVNERLQGQKLDTMNQLSGDTLAFKERRTDDYPDLNLYLELLKQSGASGV